ncbi:MAG: GNAT family N-acetyltransferase [Candidatus Dormibacteraeota bacterium]|nr:GNAT family N-acetyltransferase [Candidatus Dormibacteraeota bacterium]
MDEWQRAIDFMRALDQRCAEEVVDFRWGRAFVNRTLGTVPDLNYLVTQGDLNGVTADELTTECERIQAPVGRAFRRVNVDDREAAERLLPGFAELGFRAERFCVMVHHRPADRYVDVARVERVDWATYRRGRKQEIDSWAPSALIAEQALAKQELTSRIVDTTYLAVVEDAGPVSFCEVRREGSVAQIEFVETLDSYRRRGMARQVVTAALGAVRGVPFVFLVADLFDWPQHFYTRLGFETVGIESRFMRDLHG